jgi:small-conductance mechanosensitive channel
MNKVSFRKNFYFTIAAVGAIAALLIALGYSESFLKDRVWALIISLFGLSDSSDMGQTAVDIFTNALRIIKVILWMAIIVFLVRFFSALFFDRLFRRDDARETPALIKNIFSIIVYMIAFFIIFKYQYPNTDLTSLFTTSTIVGLVVGLALQDTLGNLFAGIALQADQPFQVGDVISLNAPGLPPGAGTGVVESITWRGVKIRTFTNKLILFSNSALGKEAIEVAPRQNLNARIVFFNTLYTHSPARTIKIVRDVVRQVENVSNKIRPVVRIKNLAADGIDWEVKYWLEDYSKFNDTDALIRQRIWYAFEREDINFAYPTRTVYLKRPEPKPDVEVLENDMFERLSNVQLFAPLSDEETLKLAGASSRRVYAPGEPIVRAGQDGTSMFVVHRGDVQVQIKDGAAMTTVATLREGDIFGEMGLFTGEPRAATVIASEEAEVLEIGHRALKPLLEGNPSLAKELSETIAARKIELDSRKAEARTTVEAETTGIFNSIKKFFGLE